MLNTMSIFTHIKSCTGRKVFAHLEYDLRLKDKKAVDNLYTLLMLMCTNYYYCKYPFNNGKSTKFAGSLDAYYLYQD